MDPFFKINSKRSPFSRKSHEDVVFGFALKDTVDVDEVGVVDFDEDVELSGEELFHEISGGSGGIHDFAR
jgi:hypothetical protein